MRLIDLSTTAADSHATRDAVRIGDSADGRPLYRAEAGWEPTTAYEMSHGGNWIESRVEFARLSPPEGIEPHAEVLAELPAPEIEIEIESAAPEASADSAAPAAPAAIHLELPPGSAAPRADAHAAE